MLLDRRDPASLLWPRRQALFDLLTILNDPDLTEVWKEDETIGWVYQYFNSDEERRQMRAESQAPRNSRELAVRNQFFTPRYVVEFLTDNTLGRIWYEMCQGNTHLVYQCNYLVQRPIEIFLGEGESPSDESSVASHQSPAADHRLLTADDLSQEKLLKQPVYITFRAKKDPRDLKILDPACGSGHFLLYAFDLLVIIYEEAWKDDTGPSSKATGHRLRDDYAMLKDLQRALPELVLRHNLHGIDIDPRAAQIAALALWMRAQRAYKDFGIARGERPPIAKTNIVVAEPMPGEKELQQEFIASLDKKLGQLVEWVFEKMDLAGEAGSLLKIEAEIQSAIRDIYDETGELFRKSDEERWKEAEEKLVEALRVYAEQAQNGRVYQRRLFAEDTARGFAFIDLCQKRYDAIIMNPPFGLPANRTRSYVDHAFPRGKHDLAASFLDRWAELVANEGQCGAIVVRSPFFLTRLSEWRDSLWDLADLQLYADLGGGVLDTAVVETCLVVLSKKTQSSDTRSVSIFFRALDALEKGIRLFDLVNNLCQDVMGNSIFLHSIEIFRAVPNSPLCYWAPVPVFLAHLRMPPIESKKRAVRCGLGTLDDFRFVRLWPEVDSSDSRWIRFALGGVHSPYFGTYPTVVNWIDNGKEIKSYVEAKVGSASRKVQAESYYFQPGLRFPRRTHRFSPNVLPPGCIFSTGGQAVLAKPEELPFLLGLLNSAPFNYLLRLRLAREDLDPQFEVGLIKATPLPAECPGIGDAAMYAYVLAAKTFSEDELSNVYSGPEVLQFPGSTLAERIENVMVQASCVREEFERAHKEVNRLAFEAYGFDEELRDELAFDSDRRLLSFPPGVRELTQNLISWAVGVAFGRWTSDLELMERVTGSLLEPLRLPPAYQTQQREPLTGAGFVHERGHRDDLTTRVVVLLSTVLRLSEDELSASSAALLEFGRYTDLRDWFASDFFAEHIRRYSDARRKAPIYWQLATPSVSYSIWLYYHRFTKDTFYKVLNDYVTPKLQYEERRLTGLLQSAGGNPTASQRKEVADQEAFVEELRLFHEEVARIAPLWNPDLNDGVIINFAPLWRLVPHHRAWQKECKDCWDTLVAGDYDWSHLAMHLWPERVVPKCAEDRSLAIAHGLEDIFWIEGADGKWQPRKVDKATVDQLIAERTSPAVKEALHNLLNAPALTGGRRSSLNQTVRRASRQRSRVTPATTRTNGTASESASRTDPAILDAVKQVIAPAADGASKPEILAATGLTTSQWNAAISALLAQGVVTKTGERRGTRYYSAETGGQS